METSEEKSNRNTQVIVISVVLVMVIIYLLYSHFYSRPSEIITGKACLYGEYPASWWKLDTGEYPN
jgi:hypothetical protein